jgi:putative aldouronate transport system substrate-binding protein
MTPAEQTSEFYNGLPQPVIDVFNAYGVSTYVEMIGSANVQTGPWYPLWSFSNNFTTETPGGVAWAKVGEVKHEWLPKLVMSSDFDATWDEYMKAYEAAKPEDFLKEVQDELDKRIAAAAK